MRSEAERDDYWHELHDRCEECDETFCTAERDHEEGAYCPFMCGYVTTGVEAHGVGFCSPKCLQRFNERAEAGADEPLTADIPLWCSSCERRFPSLAAMALNHPCVEIAK